MFDWINREIQAHAIDGFSWIPSDTRVTSEIGCLTRSNGNTQQCLDSIYQNGKASGFIPGQSGVNTSPADLHQPLQRGLGKRGETWVSVAKPLGRIEEMPTSYTLNTLTKWKVAFTKLRDWSVSTCNDCALYWWGPLGGLNRKKPWFRDISFWILYHLNFEW